MTKRLFTIAKYPVALGLLWFVLQQADWQSIYAHAKNIAPYWIFLAVASFTAAQICAVMRMNFYYRKASKPIEFIYALKLHYVALFYNIILPGGIGGDGYKVLILKKNAGYPAKEGVKIQLLTRFNGLLILVFSILLTLPFLSLPIAAHWLWLSVIGGMVLVLMVYAPFIRYVMRASSCTENHALPYSLCVQGFNVGCMAALWLGLSDGHNLAEYILLFQLAAFAGMIPITIGGLGIREATFFFGADVLNRYSGTQLDPELGIVISLLVFAITVLSALIGMRWLGAMNAMKPCANTAL